MRDFDSGRPLCTTDDRDVPPHQAYNPSRKQERVQARLDTP